MIYLGIIIFLIVYTLGVCFVYDFYIIYSIVNRGKFFLCGDEFRISDMDGDMARRYPELKKKADKTKHGKK